MARWGAAAFIARLRLGASGHDGMAWKLRSKRSGTRRLLLRGGGGAPPSARRRAGKHDGSDLTVRALSCDSGHCGIGAPNGGMPTIPMPGSGRDRRSPPSTAETPSPMGDNVTRDPLPAASPVRRPHGRLAPRAGLSRGAQRHRARVVHAAGGPLAARVPRPPRRHAHARRLPRPGDGVGDHAAAGAPAPGRRGHLLQRHRGAAEARRRRRRDPARPRSRLRSRVCGCRGRRRADGRRPRAPRRGIRARSPRRCSAPSPS